MGLLFSHAIVAESHTLILLIEKKTKTYELSYEASILSYCFQKPTNFFFFLTTNAVLPYFRQ